MKTTAQHLQARDYVRGLAYALLGWLTGLARALSDDAEYDDLTDRDDLRAGDAFVLATAVGILIYVLIAAAAGWL